MVEQLYSKRNQQESNMEFEGKVVAITGGGSGIGKETATRFVAQGANVVINGRNAAKLQAAAHEIDPSGKKVTVSVGDIAKPETGSAMVEIAVSRFGKLDILINNAGVFNPKPFLDLTEVDYDWYLDTILKGKFFAAQAAAKVMKDKGGVIVQTGSMWAIQAIGATPSAAYSAANAGVHAMVRNLAIELAPYKIRINAVAPAVVETPVYNTFLSDEQVKAVLPTFNSFHPLGRNGQPGDIAEAILFLASERSSWITGVVLSVDGGVTACRQ
jgi:NAD(P)-dependent dehydrogenase (short-subunit alcohol dehydrogenase family)